MLRKVIVFFIILTIFLSAHAWAKCTLTMGYRSNERLPLIAKAPSNEGLYKELYTLAAQKIGCVLKIRRAPKKRILRSLKSGAIDFYPGFNYTDERAQFVFYIKNGLPGGDIGISRTEMPQVFHLQQLQGYTLLQALGAAELAQDIPGVYVHKVSEMSVDHAIKLIRLKRGDFYIYNKSTIDYYIKTKNIKDIKIHEHCCGGVQPLYLAFSRNSVYFWSKKNPHFNPNKATSPDNLPDRLDESSLAYRFQQALGVLKASGETDRLYRKYYLQSETQVETLFTGR